jgi:FkbM family methyltransferase
MSKIQKAVSIGKNEGAFEMFSRITRYFISITTSKIKKFKYKREAERTERNTITTKYSEADFLIDSWNEYRVTHNGISEQVLVDDIIEQSHESDTFYDIGAAIGTHSCLVAPYVDRTIAFEPYPPNAVRTEENAGINGVDVNVFEYALSNESGEATMKIHREAVGDAGHSLVIDQSKHGNTFEVTTKCGDDLVENNLPAPNILKIDAEGAEEEVLRGFESTISSENCRLVYVEIHKPELIDNICSFLGDEKFETEIIDARGDTKFLRGKKK